MKPAIKYAGGKTWLLSRLLELYAPHRNRRLVEPFVGSMAVSLGLNPERALLSDANEHLVNFHHRLCDPRPFILEMENTETHYYMYRTLFNDFIKSNNGASQSQTAAEIFYYLNRTGFNGLNRTNSSGEFNVPYGKYNSITYRRDFSEYAPLLARWDISCHGFEKTIIELDDFVYLDPPYDDTFTNYSTGGFSWRDQCWLALIYSKHAGPVVASNQATERVLKLYGELGFTVSVLEAPRMISSDGDRTPALEMLATKNV